MNEIMIRIAAPELAAALEHLAAALGSRAPVMQQNAVRPGAPQAAPAVARPAPAVPVAPPPAAPVYAPPAAPVQPPAATSPAPTAQAPVAPPPQYTFDQLQLAGASLMDLGKIKELQGLFQKYGIQRLPDLPKEQYGAWATDLRALGARI